MSYIKGPTTFHGVEFTMKDGSKRYVQPIPEVKQELENYFNMNQELNPRTLVEELGWTYIKDVPYDNAHPMSLYEKRYSDGWADGYNYTWTLYVPPFNYFGTWRGADFIIEEYKQGGFVGASKKYSIFRGRLNSIFEYFQIVQLTSLKQAYKDDSILKQIIQQTKSF